MDNDDQDIRDYENEIYRLNTQGTEESDEETTQSESTSRFTSEDDRPPSPVKTPRKRKRIRESPARSRKSTPIKKSEESEANFDDPSELSESEREFILSQLYHGSSVPTTFNIPVNGVKSSQKSPRKKKTSKLEDINGDTTSAPFTFNIDLDNFPSAPQLQTPPDDPVEVATLDSDGDYPSLPRDRYFAPSSPSPPRESYVICYRCNQPGHVRSDCPNRVCHSCGALNSHSTHQCPSLQTCKHCSQMGHSHHDCPFKSIREDPSKSCSMCGEYGHISSTCHQIWRYYKPIDPARMKMSSRIERWCYNCAERDHLGDDCNRPRPFHVQGGRIGLVISAFGEGNVPEWAKLSNAQVMRKQEVSKSKKGKKREKDDDDWFANRDTSPRREPPKPVRKIGGIKIGSDRDGPRGSNASTSSSRQNGPSRSLADRIEKSSSHGRPPPSSKPYRSRQQHHSSRDHLGDDQEWEDEIHRWRRDRDRERLRER